MLNLFSIAPVFASLIGAFAFHIEPEQPRAALTGVQHVAVQSAEKGAPLVNRASIDADTQWSDVYEVLETDVANPEARERLGALVSELETLAYAGEAGVDGFNSVLDLTMEEFWILTEEVGALTYAERDLVFDVLMDAITNFPMAEETIKWERDAATLSKAKCKNKTECEVSDDDKRTCTRLKEMKKQPDGTYAETGKFRCETGSLR